MNTNLSNKSWNNEVPVLSRIKDDVAEINLKTLIENQFLEE